MRRKLMLLVLESLGCLKALTNAQKQRPSIIGQARLDMTSQRCEIEWFVYDERRHAGASVITSDFDTIYVHLYDPRA